MPEFCTSLDEDAEDAVFPEHMTGTCRLGTNLMIEPDGECVPCYPLTGSRHAVGNVLVKGMKAVPTRNDAYRQATVDSNWGWHTCRLRYLCGGL